ncbi:AlbA family DNA-binding domain-containing protein [Methyloligella halotolerans]|uniref:AlbA family DNA-binding domain-containing protein n=1 Tax=Methyloligella halotolerans TaxID=1177755 RepID=UPI00147263FB|nr:ATP-binding protein [Methyloligella halotolerans]
MANGESSVVDYKKISKGLKPDDFVSFANTSDGGHVLVGVIEKKHKNGSQYGEICGHLLDDQIALGIVSKAMSCIPPVAIKLYAENTAADPLIRVHILPGENRPYSTPKGEYLIRDGSGNRALHPAELLQIFLDVETRAFTLRFEQLAGKITGSINHLELLLEKRIRDIAERLGWADSKVEDTDDTVQTVLGEVEDLGEEVDRLSERVRAMFRQDGREDPVREGEKRRLLGYLVRQLKEHPELAKKFEAGASVDIRQFGRAAQELNESDIRDTIKDALHRIERS